MVLILCFHILYLEENHNTNHIYKCNENNKRKYKKLNKPNITSNNNIFHASSTYPFIAKYENKKY